MAATPTAENAVKTTIRMGRIGRLAAAYLAVIMAVSIVFSYGLYHVTVGEADRGFERQQQTLRPNLYFVRQDVLERARNDQIADYRRHVITQLVAINIGMLVVGAWLSYYLAKRNLEPLEQALEAQARFTSDAAHELRTPLTAMKTETEVGLRDKNLSSDEARALLQSNLEEVGKLENLTNALLRLAKNGSDKDESAWQTVPVAKIITVAIDRVRTKAEKDDISIDDNTDTAASKITVRGDTDQLVELLVILLDNAIKYSAPKTNVTIAVRRSHDHFTNIAIQDRGIGIKQTDLKHIFERFYRADQSRNKHIVDGFGLGLSLAKQIAAAHHGDVFVESEQGKGSTFTVHVPSGHKI